MFFTPPPSFLSALLASALVMLSPGILPAEPPPELTLLKQVYDKMVAERVTAPYEAALSQLNIGYTGGLDRAIATAKKEGKLDIVIALEDEKKRLTDKAPIPEDDEQTPADLKKLRPIYLTALGKLMEQRGKNHSTFLPAYTKRLQDLEVTLTKADRVEEAKEVKAYRDGLAEDQDVTPATVPSKQSTKSVATPKAKGPKGDDRKAAEMLLGKNCKVRIKTRNGLTLNLPAAAALPKDEFELLGFEQSAPSTPPLAVEDVALLANLRSLTNVMVYSAPVGNQMMEALKGSTELNSIYLAQDRTLTDEALAVLKHWPKLSALRLRGAKSITSEGIRIIADTRPELRELRIMETSVDDTAIPHLLKLKGLEELWVSETRITQAGLEKLAGLRHLTDLHLSGGSITTPMDFTSCKKLRMLKIGNSVSEALFQSLGKFPSTIEELWIESIELTEAQLAILASGKGLKKITLHQLKLPPSGLASFAASAKVQEVEIYSADVSINDECLMQLSRIKTLKKVSLGKGTTEAGIDAFKKARKDVLIVR